MQRSTARRTARALRVASVPGLVINHAPLPIKLEMAAFQQHIFQFLAGTLYPRLRPRQRKTQALGQFAPRQALVLGKQQGLAIERGKAGNHPLDAGSKLTSQILQAILWLIDYLRY